MRIRCSELAHAVGGRLDGPDVDVDGASIDSRTVQAGQLFVPVVAERDGHDFVAAAIEHGAQRLADGGDDGGEGRLQPFMVVDGEGAGAMA